MWLRLGSGGDGSSSRNLFHETGEELLGGSSHRRLERLLLELAVVVPAVREHGGSVVQQLQKI
jgi:hypothetical protein